MKNKVELRNKIYQGIKTAIKNLITSRGKDNELLIVSKDRIPLIKIYLEIIR